MAGNYIERLKQRQAAATGEPQRTTAVWGPMTTRTVTGGPPRGDLEATLRYLESLGETTVVGEDAEGAA